MQVRMVGRKFVGIVVPKEGIWMPKKDPVHQVYKEERSPRRPETVLSLDPRLRGEKETRTPEEEKVSSKLHHPKVRREMTSQSK